MNDKRLKRIEAELEKSKKELIEANELLQTVLDTIPMPIFWKDKNSVFLGCNKLFAQDTGRESPSELIGDTDLNMTWSEQADLYRNDDFEIMSSGKARINYEEPHTSTDGILTWVRSTKVPLRDGEGQVFGVLGTYEDITSRKLAEQALFLEKEKLRITLMSIGDGVIVTDKKGKVLLINMVAEVLTGWPQELSRGRRIDEIFRIENEQSRIPCRNPVDLVMESGKIAGLANHTVLISRDGSERAIDDSASPITDKDGNVIGAVLVFRDVTEKRNKENEIIYLSYHDSLTGLYNRRYFEEEIRRLDVERSLPLSIIMSDVNGLKFANDVFGHAEGDRLLQSATGIIKKTCRSGDIIARWGGDEFIILLPNTPERTAQDICRRVVQLCSDENEKTISTSISLGYAVKEHPDQDMMKLLKVAEDNMYKYKFLENRSFRSSIVASIKKTLYEKSHETEEHAERITFFCRAIGTAMGLSEAKLNELELLGVLHDIGKIAVMDSVLNKPGPLTEEEWKEMKRHPEVGYRIAQSVPELAQIAEYILAHHERWDGNGYPRGLSTRSIPLMSRIVAVADAYDAMTNVRPYRKAMKKNEAIEEIIRNSGTQFDPQVVNEFLKIVSKA